MNIHEGFVKEGAST